MDIWFTLFVFVVGVAAAVGASLLLVGYISVMPITFARGKGWLWAVGILPMAIVGVPFFVAAMASTFGQGVDAAQVAKWAAVPALVLHFGAIGAFVVRHQKEFSKVAKQLGFGFLLVAVAAALLYGVGPHFAERIVAGAK